MTKPTQQALAEAITASLTPGSVAYKPTPATYMLSDIATATYGPAVAARLRRRAVSAFCAGLLEKA